jgi:hypothetical protein
LRRYHYTNVSGLPGFLIFCYVLIVPLPEELNAALQKYFLSGSNEANKSSGYYLS